MGSCWLLASGLPRPLQLFLSAARSSTRPPCLTTPQLQPHTACNNLHDIEIQKKRSTVAVQGMIIEILPPGCKIKHLGNSSIPKMQSTSSSTTVSNARGRPARATDRSRRHQNTHLETDSLLHAANTWKMTEETKKELDPTQRRTMRTVIQTSRNTGRCPAVAHTASVDDTADGEPTTLDWSATRRNPTILTPARK